MNNSRTMTREETQARQSSMRAAVSEYQAKGYAKVDAITSAAIDFDVDASTIRRALASLPRKCMLRDLRSDYVHKCVRKTDPDTNVEYWETNGIILCRTGHEVDAYYVFVDENL